VIPEIGQLAPAEESRRKNPSHFSDSLPFVEHLQLLAAFDGAPDAAAMPLGAAAKVLIDGGPAGAGEVVGPAPANRG
jgi:hypothetical protein